MADQVEIFNIEFSDTLDSINKLKAELKETRKLFNEAKPNTPEFAKYSAEVKRLDGSIKLLNNTTKDQVNALGGVNKSTKFASGSYGELKQKIDQQQKALLNLNTESKEFADTQEELIKLQAQRIEIEKKIPSLFQERIKLAVDEANTLKSLRAELKAANSAALNGDGEAAKRAAELRDQLEDLKDTTNSLKGSGVERLNTSVELLTQGFVDFDADKISTGFKGIGAAMSAIPIVFLIEGIKIIIDNFDDVVEFVKVLTGYIDENAEAVKSLTKTVEAESVVNKNLIQQYDNEITLLEAKGGQEKKLTELKKEKLKVEIAELENQVRLRFARVNEILLNDDISDSITRISIATAKKLGLDKIAEEGEKQLARDKKERYKEDLEAGREAARQLSAARTSLAVLDIEYNKKQVESAKKKSDETIKIAQEEQARLADIENAYIDKEEQRIKDSIERQKKGAEIALDIEKELLANIEKLDLERSIDKIAQANTNLLNAKIEGGRILDAQLELLNAEREQELLNTELTESQKAEIKAKYREQEYQLRIKTTSDELGAAANLSNSLGELNDAIYQTKRFNAEKGSQEEIDLAKKQFERNKAFSISTAIISGAVALVNALASVPYIPVGLAASISAAATTTATVAKISATEFKYFKGGYTRKGDPTKEAESMGNAQFHNNEYVIPDKVLSTPKGSILAAEAEKLRTGKNTIPNIGGFFDGGFTARQISRGVESSASATNDIYNLIKSLPNPVLRITELNSANKSLDVAVKSSSL